MKQISSTPLPELEFAVHWLRQIYNPEVRGASSREEYSKGTGHSLNDLRNDEFERAYAIRWLTSLISVGDELDARLGSLSEHKDASAQLLIDNAASLLAACAGTASSGIITRTYTFAVATTPATSTRTSSENDSPKTTLSLSLTDVPLENGDYSSVGAQTWGAAVVLTRLMLEDPGPSAFGLTSSSVCEFLANLPRTDNYTHTPGGTSEIRNRFRIIELGAGTGLVSTCSPADRA